MMTFSQRKTSRAVRAIANVFAPSGTRRRRVLQLSKRSWQVYRAGGVGRLQKGILRWVQRQYRRFNPIDPYKQWIAQFEPGPVDLDRQRHWSETNSSRMQISIVTPLYQPPLKVLKETVQSVQDQSYPYWCLYLVVAEGESPRLKRWVEQATRNDPRVRIVWIPRNEGISAATNAALDVADDEYVAFLDHDDTLAPFALYEVVRHLEEYPETDVVYSDEDLISSDGRRRYSPVLKPDWSPEMLLNHNYICHFTLLRRSLVMEQGGLRPQFDGTQDWDLLLRVTEQTDRVHHIPQVLYHWRQSAISTSGNIDAKPYAISAQQEALKDWFGKRGLTVEIHEGVYGLMRPVWPVQGEPLVSIVIPNKNRLDLIERSVQGLLEFTDYSHVEIVIVDNQSTDPDVLEYYERITVEHDVQIVPFNRPFNYSAACNAGAKIARGEYLLFLNNDIAVTHSDWLDELLRWAQHSKVGLVGPKLVYPDGTIQHAGMVLGLHGLVDHPFRGAPEKFSGIFGAVEFCRNLSAVTGACQLLSRALFWEVGGYDEEFQLTFSDVTLCLKIRELGYRIVYTPYCRLIHDECATRKGDVESDARRFAHFLSRHRIYRDPYFHPALSASSNIPQFSLENDSNAETNLRIQIERYLAVEPTVRRNRIREAIVGQGRRITEKLPAGGLLPSGFLPLLIWLRDHLPQYGLDDFAAYQEWLDEDLGEAVAEAYLNNPDWQRKFPLAMTAFGRSKFLEFLRCDGHIKDAADPQVPEVLTPVEQLRLLSRFDEEAAEMLSAARQDEKGAERLSLVIRNCPRLRNLVDEDWLQRLEREVATKTLQRPGANILGHFSYPAGAGQAARSYLAAARAVGVHVAPRDIPHPSLCVHKREFLGLDYRMPDLHDITLSVIQPELMQERSDLVAADYRSEGYQIGLWVCELERIRDNWYASFDSVDEVWAPSEHVAAALRKVAPFPVSCIPYCLQVPEAEPLSREEFGIGPEEFVFLFVFDASSVVERKNPLAVIEAFRRAFSPSERVTLVLKIGRSETAPEEMGRLRSAARGLNVRFITAPMSRERSYGLISACDCYVSLHRAEGFGLTMAEAMWFGKPVIATGYSANLDYMNSANSLLVSCEMIEVPKGLPFYHPPAEWADASVDDASCKMRWVVDNRNSAAELGRQASIDIRRHSSPEAVGRRMSDRLVEIEHRTSPKGSSRTLRETQTKSPNAVAGLR